MPCVPKCISIAVALAAMQHVLGFPVPQKLTSAQLLIYNSWLLGAKHAGESFWDRHGVISRRGHMVSQPANLQADIWEVNRAQRGSKDRSSHGTGGRQKANVERMTQGCEACSQAQATVNLTSMPDAQWLLTWQANLQRRQSGTKRAHQGPCQRGQLPGRWCGVQTTVRLSKATRLHKAPVC